MKKAKLIICDEINQGVEFAEKYIVKGRKCQSLTKEEAYLNYSKYLINYDAEVLIVINPGELINIVRSWIYDGIIVDKKHKTPKLIYPDVVIVDNTKSLDQDIFLNGIFDKVILKNIGPCETRKTERVSSKIRAQLMPYISLVERYKVGQDIGQFIDLIEKNQAELLSLIDKTAEFEQFWLESMVGNKKEVQTVDEFLNQEIK